MSTCKYNNLFYFVEKKYTSAQSPDNEIIASDLNFYKIVKVKRKVNENVMIRKLQFFIPQ